MPNPNGTKLSLPVTFTDNSGTYAAIITKVHADAVDLLVFPPAGTGEPPMPAGNIPFSASTAPNTWNFA